MTLLLEGRQWSLTLSQRLGQQGDSAYLRPLRTKKEAQGSHMQVQTYFSLGHNREKLGRGGSVGPTKDPWCSWSRGRGREEKNYRWSDSTKDLVIPSISSSAR